MVTGDPNSKTLIADCRARLLQYLAESPSLGLSADVLDEFRRHIESPASDALLLRWHHKSVRGIPAVWYDEREMALERSTRSAAPATHIYPKARTGRRAKGHSATPKKRPGRLPSKETGVHWIAAIAPNARVSSFLGPRHGKWLVFLAREQVDLVWEQVKNATEAGHLGTMAKVSTGASPQKGHVICVYTHDFEDEADVRRVRQELRRLGIVQRIPYKSDADTASDIYSATGHKRIGKYFE